MVPVMLLTGFLGSGKTSLLNRLLRLGGELPGKMALIVHGHETYCLRLTRQGKLILNK